MGPAPTQRVLRPAWGCAAASGRWGGHPGWRDVTGRLEQPVVDEDGNGDRLEEGHSEAVGRPAGEDRVPAAAAKVQLGEVDRPTAADQSHRNHVDVEALEHRAHP